MFRPCWLLPLLLVPCLPAQDPLARLPREATVRIECDGPAAWRTKFAGTNLALALGDREVQDLLRPMWERLDAFLDEGKRELGHDIPALWQKLVGYGGRVVATVELQIEDFEQEPGVQVCIVATPDGRTDLAKLCEEIAAIAQDNDHDDLEDLEVAGRRLRVIRDPDVGAALPFEMDGHLVLLLGTDLDALAKRFLGSEPAAGVAAPGAGDKALSLRFSLRQLLDKVDELAAQDENLATLAKLFEVFGGKQITDATVEIAPNNADTVIDFALVWRGEMPAAGQLMKPDDARHLQTGLDYVPMANENWGTTVFRAGKLFDLIVAGVDAVSEQSGLGSDAMLQMFEQEVGLRLKEDLFDHIGDQMIVTAISSAEAADLQQDMISAALPFHALAMTVRDGAALATSIEKLLRSNGLHAGRKSEEYQGIKVYELALGGLITLEYATTDRLAALGFGEAGGKAVRQILAEDRARNAGRPQAELDRGLQRLVGNAGGVVGGLAISPVQQFYEVIERAMLEEGDRDLEEFLDMAGPAIAGITKAMDRAGIKRSVSLYVWEKNRVVNRVVW